MNQELTVRPFEARDVPALLELMKALAVFEGYIDDFKVTEDTLLKEGLISNPTFSALVAEGRSGLLGYGVFYTIPFTYDLQPTVVMKELYVSSKARGLGVGSALFDEIKKRALDLGAARLQWLVLPSNDPAKRFYKSKGAKEDHSWEHWQLTL